MIQISQDGPLYKLKGHRLKFQKKPHIILALSIDFVLANSADHDEMSHNAVFHLDLHCLPKYLFRGYQSKKGKDSCHLMLNLDSQWNDAFLRTYLDANVFWKKITSYQRAQAKRVNLTPLLSLDLIRLTSLCYP